MFAGVRPRLSDETWHEAQVRPFPPNVSLLKRFPPTSACVAVGMVNVADKWFSGVAVPSEKFAFVSAPPGKLRLVVPTIGSAGAGLPAAVEPKPSALLTSVSPVKLPYETQKFLWKALPDSAVFPLKHTFPEIGEMTGGMMNSGA